MNKYSDSHSTAFEALSFISADCPHADWIRIAMAAHAAGITFEEFDAWSSEAKSYSRGASKATWKSLEKSSKGGITPATLFYYAAREGWRQPRATASPRSHAVGPLIATNRSQPTSPRTVDDVVDLALERKRASINMMWEESLPLTESCVATKYLIARGIKVPQNLDSLRWIPELKYWDSELQRNTGTYPALLAAVTSPEGEILTLHRTYLSQDGGGKAKVSSPKKLMPPAGNLTGSSIPLGPPISRGTGDVALGVAEGLETALASSQLFGIPTWSCISASLMEKFVPPASVTAIYIFADNDRSKTGQESAERLAQRLVREGYKVRVHTPAKEGDWNDVLLEVNSK